MILCKTYEDLEKDKKLCQCLYLPITDITIQNYDPVSVGGKQSPLDIMCEQKCTAGFTVTGQISGETTFKTFGLKSLCWMDTLGKTEIINEYEIHTNKSNRMVTTDTGWSNHEVTIWWGFVLNFDYMVLPHAGTVTAILDVLITQQKANQINSFLSCTQHNV